MNMQRRAALTVGITLLCVVGANTRTTVTLCSSGCTYTDTMANLQTAVNAAAQGDTILLENTGVFVGTLVMTQHAGSAGITLATGVDASGNVLSASNWPAATHRLIPPSYTDNTNESGLSTNYTGQLAKLIPDVHNAAAIRTQYPGETSAECTGSGSSTCRAHDYILKWLDISAPPDPLVPGGCAVVLGTNFRAVDGLPNSNAQDSAAKEPYNFTLNQVYIHGTDTAGSRHGLCVHATNTKIYRSYLSNHWDPASADANAIYVINTTGGTSYENGFLADNNYVESAGEPLLTGGDGARMAFTDTPITLASSSTGGATLNAALPDYVREGDCVSVLIGSAKAQACLDTINGDRTVVTFTTTLAGSPDVPGGMRGGVTPQYLTFTNNWFHSIIAHRGTSRGNVKNLFELKIGKHIKIQWNYFSDIWESGQTGTGILFTILNQDGDLSGNGDNDGTELADVLLEYNVIENAAACLVINGIDGTNSFSQRADGFTIRHVACLNLNQNTYGDGTDDFFQAVDISSGHIPIRAMPKNVTFDHVLIDSRANQTIFRFNTDASTAPQAAAVLKAENFILRNSIIRNPTSGPLLFFFVDEYTGGSNSGADSWDRAVGNGLGTCLNNALSLESSGAWTFCTSSVFPTTLAQVDAAEVDHAGGDHRVDQGCGALTADCYDNAGTDGGDLGPDWSILNPAMAAARSGNPEATGGGKARIRMRTR